MKKNILLLKGMMLALLLPAQNDSLQPVGTGDTLPSIKVNKDAVYDRPFISIGKTSTAIGGYVEGNTNYFVTDGVAEGFSMELRRFNIFLYSPIGNRIRFLSELEFEHGTEEIALETAMLDFEIASALSFRAGILLAPLGAFNQNHDGPKWEFIERPLVSTQIIPSTLSEIGFGFHGKLYRADKVFSYEAYLVNGLQDGVILNTEGRTFLQAGKSEEMFAEDNNGQPMFTGKIGFKHRKIAEIGLSYYGGVYNTFQIEGTLIDSKRRLSVIALDLNTVIFRKLTVNAEAALVSIDVPAAAGQFFGSRQKGFYAEAVYTVLRGTVLGYENTAINVNLRGEYIDYNDGTFADTGTRIYDEVIALVPGISIRPSSSTVLRLNYRYHWEYDILGNPAIRTAGFQVGVASYF
ncbi:MAG: hypothetical protein AB1458_14295 [Bacteroidota bacterium]